ncbi:DUF5719 family protein [Agromyces sp. MMS24-K17]|uniref:DUF5719 family protein n=1 Tax=Agromyces sp. MMS24-K17 TaxID=3372850 RepID=UPI0037541CA0
MPDRRRIVRGALRATAALATVAIGAAAVAAAVIVPWPESRAEPESVVVAPTESRQQRVCPGPLLELGDDALAATTATSFGPADLVTTVVPADADVEEIPLGAPDNPASGTDGGPTVLQVEPGVADIGMLAGAQAQQALSETLAGLAVAACREPVADAWLVGGSTALGRVTLVLLANPTEVAAEVDLRVFGEAGPVDAPSALGLVVPPGTQRIVSLAGLAPDLASPVVHVTSTGGRIAATLEQTAIDGLSPAGAEFVAASAAPADEARIPGVVIVESGQVVDADHAEGDAFPALRLLAPGDDPVDVSVGVVPEGLGSGTTIDVSLQPGQVTDVPLGELEPGTYAVDLLADGPIVASARASIAAIPTSEPGALADPGDLAWYPVPSPLIGDLAVAVPDAPSPVLHLVAPTGADVEAIVAPVSGGAEQRVLVPAGGGAALDLEPGQGVVLRQVEGLSASISFGDGRTLASMPLEPPGAVDAPIRVYPR